MAAEMIKVPSSLDLTRGDAPEVRRSVNNSHVVVHIAAQGHLPPYMTGITPATALQKLTARSFLR